MERRLAFPISVLILLGLFLLSPSCEKDDIVPEEGYSWPDNERSYWPTSGWKTAPMEEHQVDPVRMEEAYQFALNDDLTRALLVVKDGYLVYEKYFGEGDTSISSNLWSVTKSFSSALVGILIDQNEVGSTNQKMAELMPEYPQFGEITLHQVLTMTTGLAWSEEGKPWVDWIFSEDWVAEALARGQINEPGKKFKYSSGNSHFLTSLVYYRTGTFPGEYAKSYLFDPLGIPFHVLSEPVEYEKWEDYITPLSQTWRKDPKGIETASFSLYLTARDMAKFGFLYLNKGRWENQALISEQWIEASTAEHVTDVYERYSYGYQWFITFVAGVPTFLASGFGGQIIAMVPSRDLVVVIKYEAETPVHPSSGTSHDDMHLLELVVRSVPG